VLTPYQPFPQQGLGGSVGGRRERQGDQGERRRQDFDSLFDHFEFRWSLRAAIRCMRVNKKVSYSISEL
jgi:hypothetical protein